MITTEIPQRLREYADAIAKVSRRAVNPTFYRFHVETDAYPQWDRRHEWRNGWAIGYDTIPDERRPHLPPERRYVVFAGDAARKLLTGWAFIGNTPEPVIPAEMRRLTR